MAVWISLKKHIPNCIVQILWRGCFVSAAPQNYARVIAVTQNLVAYVCHVKLGIYGIGIVELEKFVPQQEAVFVAKLKEVVASALPAPVSYHIKVQVAVHLNLRFEALFVEALQSFLHAPVAAAHKHPNAVYGQRKIRIARL